MRSSVGAGAQDPPERPEVVPLRAITIALGGFGGAMLNNDTTNQPRPPAPRPTRTS